MSFKRRTSVSLYHAGQNHSVYNHTYRRVYWVARGNIDNNRSLLPREVLLRTNHCVIVRMQSNLEKGTGPRVPGS